MNKIIFPFVILLGIILSFCGLMFNNIVKQNELTGTVEKQTESRLNEGTSEIHYETKIKNTNFMPIRLCGGQLDWCGKNGCYKVITPFPLILEPRQETTITVIVSPREGKVSETELILYADGKGLEGLTPIKIKLPAMTNKIY